MSGESFLRRESAGARRKRLGLAPGVCTWCAGPCKKPRRTWCCDECVEAFKLVNFPTYQRDAVFARDGGVCSECGLAAHACALLANQIAAAVRRAGGCRWRPDVFGRIRLRIPAKAPRCECVGCRAQREFAAGWQVDHIVPVVEGGGLCTLDNLRTLCSKCHKAETAKLAARRAAHRRGKKCGNVSTG